MKQGITLTQRGIGSNCKKQAIHTFDERTAHRSIGGDTLSYTGIPENTAVLISFLLVQMELTMMGGATTSHLKV